MMSGCHDTIQKENSILSNMLHIKSLQLLFFGSLYLKYLIRFFCLLPSGITTIPCNFHDAYDTYVSVCRK